MRTPVKECKDAVGQLRYEDDEKMRIIEVLWKLKREGCATTRPPPVDFTLLFRGNL